MKVLCTGIACGNVTCPHAEPHEPIENGDEDCQETSFCGIYGGMVRCGEVEEVRGTLHRERAAAIQHPELVPA